MKFIDDLIVTLALRLLRGVMAIGTGLVYVQFCTLAVLLGNAGTVSCLLYTSPSPRDRTISRMPSSSLKKKKNITYLRFLFFRQTRFLQLYHPSHAIIVIYST